MYCMYQCGYDFADCCLHEYMLVLSFYLILCMKYVLRGWLGSRSMECALRPVAVLLRSERLGVGSPMVLAAFCVICISLFLLGADHMLKMHEEQ